MRKEIIGNAELYLGDCREILPFLPKVDAVITDPPYGIGFGRKHTKWSANRGTILGEWDKEIPDLNKFPALADIVVIWGGERFSLPVSRGWLAWIKPDAPPTFSSLELAWTNLDRPARYLVHCISATNKEREAHPTQKPLRIMNWCIDQVGRPETILDPFMGSGTTGAACMNHNRKFIGIEIEPKYFDIACRRIEDAQRQKRLFA